MFSDPSPRLGDSDNNLLFKIAQYYAGICPSADAAPKLGDSNNNLLFKIAKSLSTCPPVPEEPIEEN